MTYTRRDAPDSFWNNLSKPSPVPAGTRIRLMHMPNDPSPVPDNMTGTVVGGNGSQLDVKWDNGRTLFLIVGVDSYTVIK